MNTQRLKIFISRDCMWGDRFAVRMRSRINDSIPWAVAEPLKFRVRSKEEAGSEIEPAFMLTRDDAQAFIDELWSAGLRPTEGTGSAGSLAATERHLEDMRSLVFKTAPTQ